MFVNQKGLFSSIAALAFTVLMTISSPLIAMTGPGGSEQNKDAPSVPSHPKPSVPGAAAAAMESTDQTTAAFATAVVPARPLSLRDLLEQKKAAFLTTLQGTQLGRMAPEAILIIVRDYTPQGFRAPPNDVFKTMPLVYQNVVWRAEWQLKQPFVWDFVPWLIEFSPDIETAASSPALRKYEGAVGKLSQSLDRISLSYKTASSYAELVYRGPFKNFRWDDEDKMFVETVGASTAFVKDPSTDAFKLTMNETSSRYTYFESGRGRVNLRARPINGSGMIMGVIKPNGIWSTVD